MVLRGDEDGSGKSVLVHLTVRAGGAVAGEHIHPSIDERFEVISGTLGVRIDGEGGRLTPGEHAFAGAGVPHNWWNAGADNAEVVVEVSPPDPRFAQMIATMFGLANDGKCNSKGMPGPLQLALVGSEFNDVIRFTRPPAAVQRVMLPVLGALGRARGLEGIYPE